MAKILILEDERDFAAMIAEDLETAGHKVSSAVTGTAALEKLEAEKFDLVIIDIFIRVEGKLVPDGGLLLLSRMRMSDNPESKSDLAKMPTLVISGAFESPWNHDLVNYARFYGANHLLKKPFVHEQLFSAVDALLANPSMVAARL